MNRLWLGDGYVTVGDTLPLIGGYTGPATIVAIRPIHTIAEGTLLIDPRTLELVRCAGCDPSGARCYIAYSGSVLDGCAMPNELFPIVELDPAHVDGGDPIDDGQ